MQLSIRMEYPVSVRVRVCGRREGGASEGVAGGKGGKVLMRKTDSES